MTQGHDDIVDPGEIDAVLEHVLAGGAPSPGAPAWATDVAVLVVAARAPADPDELAGEDDIVGRMREALAAGGDPPTPTGATDLRAHRARHAEGRAYRAKHAAARLEASRHPVVRSVGRVMAMKAAAVTTAAVLGVAAAAATTGIVATVVVPALNDIAREPEPAPATTEHPPSHVTTPSADDRAGDDDVFPQVTCPILPACDHPDLAPQPVTRPSTTVPSTPGTTVADAAATTETTTTTTTPATTTTVASPPTTLPTSTTTVPGDPPESGTVVAQSLPGSNP